MKSSDNLKRDHSNAWQAACADGVFSKHVGGGCVRALAITVLLVWSYQSLRLFSNRPLARILEFFSIATAIAFGLVIPLLSAEPKSRNAARSPSASFQSPELLLPLADSVTDPVTSSRWDAMRWPVTSGRLAPTGPSSDFLTSP